MIDKKLFMIESELTRFNNLGLNMDALNLVDENMQDKEDNFI